MSDIAGYRLDAVHAFRVRTLHALGYQLRVVLGNGSDRRADWQCDYRVDVSLSPVQGRRGRFFPAVATIAPGRHQLLDCESFVEGLDEDVELVCHLVPERLAPRSVDGLITLSREELYFYFNAQDHFAEYYRKDGFAAGVLYQSGAFNYDLFSKERSTLIQAPKCYVSTEVDTMLSVVNSSADPDYDTTAHLRCVLVSSDGARAVAWQESLPPFAPRLLSLRDRLRTAGARVDATPRFSCLYATSKDATLLPITIQRNDRTGTIGLEHSLPPLYYAETARGPARMRAIEALDTAFAGAVRP
jgi:hypothetical protein